MKFGVREICDVTFKALQTCNIGSMAVQKGQPVLFIDSAKTSTIEGAATTVYATGGRGNSRLLTWEGEKTLTFTVEDALLSEVGFAILSGAGLFDASSDEPAFVHTTQMGYVETVNSGSETYKAVELLLEGEEEVADKAPIFVMSYKDGSITGLLKANPAIKEVPVTGGGKNIYLELDGASVDDGDQVFVDFYVKKEIVREMQIDAANFGGFYYVEGSTLFRRESDGKDLPAEIVFPKVKIQSNFTFSMASSGDPSTFTFTMDAMPGYTFFNKTKKALCAIQIIDDTIKAKKDSAITIAPKNGDYLIKEETEGDSSNSAYYNDQPLSVENIEFNSTNYNGYVLTLPESFTEDINIYLPSEGFAVLIEDGDTFVQLNNAAYEISEEPASVTISGAAKEMYTVTIKASAEYQQERIAILLA